MHAATPLPEPMVQCLAAVAILGCMLLSACSAPVVYPRSADLLDAGSKRLRVSTNLGLAPTSAEVGVSPEEAQTYSDVSAVHGRGAGAPVVGWLFGPLASTEGGADFSLGFCEAGGLLSLLRAGAELRCAVLQEDRGAPLSLALSTAYLYQLEALFRYSAHDGHGFRGGADSSIRLGHWGPLLGAYVDHSMQPRQLIDDDLPKQDAGEGPFATNSSGEVRALRDEWRLSVPLGVTFYGKRSESSLAIVTEYTLAASDLQPPRLNASEEYDGQVQSFEQHWAVFFTVSTAFTR